MRCHRFVVWGLVLALAGAGCADNLVPITYEWNKAQVTMLQRIATLKAVLVDLRQRANANPRFAVHDWYGDQLRGSLRAFEQRLVDVELQFQTNETAVADAMKAGKAVPARQAVETAEADFDAAVARAEKLPAEIRALLEKPPN
jgi:hypothetical protein